jgi:uncharacterized membrane protein YvlD (DUF360 family)
MGLPVRVALAVAANAVALLLAAILLEGVEIGAGSFVAAVVVYSVISVGLQRSVVGKLRPRSGAS